MSDGTVQSKARELLIFPLMLVCLHSKLSTNTCIQAIRLDHLPHRRFVLVVSFRLPAPPYPHPFVPITILTPQAPPPLPFHTPPVALDGGIQRYCGHKRQGSSGWHGIAWMERNVDSYDVTGPFDAFRRHWLSRGPCNSSS